MLFAAGLCSSTLFAQQEPRSNKENSPYSRYGLGDIRTGTSPLLRAMANVSSAYASTTAVNTDNPASYATLRLTTYEVGGEGSIRNLSTTDQRFRTGTASFSYLAIGIPLGKYGGMAIGLRPQTRVFYDVADSGTTAGIGRTVAEFRGDGGLNYAYIGLAGKYQGFSAGVNVGYSFGTLVTSSLMNNIDSSAAVNTEVTRNTRIGGVYWKGGLMYETRFNKKMALRVGGTVAIRQDLGATRDEYAIAFNNLPNANPRDTPYSNTNIRGEYRLPTMLSGGVMLLGSRWMVGLDVQRTAWEQYRAYGLRDSVASSSLRVALGGEYTPALLTNANAKYFSRVTYRLGFYTGRDYVMLRNTDLPVLGVTFGASLPIRKTSDRIHMAFDIGRRGTTDNRLIQESYFRFSLGISLGDRWFIKRKYD